MKVFLTGGTGFIGSHILMKLLNNGHQVTALARNKNKIPRLLSLANLKVIEGSIDNHELIKDILPEHDVCIHVALHWGEPGAYKMLTNDTTSTIFLADLAATVGCKQFIYTSSTAVIDYYYMVREEEKDDKSNFIKISNRHMPVTYYGATKAASENFLRAISYQTQMKVNIVRPGYTYGNPAIIGAPTQPDTRFYDIVKKAKSNEDIELIKNDGTQFIWADDLAEIYLQILESGVNRKVYFGLAKNNFTWEEIAKQAIKLSNSNSKIKFRDNNSDNDPLLLDVSDIKEDFGLEFSPSEKIEEHLEYIIQIL